MNKYIIEPTLFIQISNITCLFVLSYFSHIYQHNITTQNYNNILNQIIFTTLDTLWHTTHITSRTTVLPLHNNQIHNINATNQINYVITPVSKSQNKLFFVPHKIHH